MSPAEFDSVAEHYEALHRQNVALSGEEPAYFAAYKVADMRRLWERNHPRREPEAILDFGGGVGASLPFLRRAFPAAALTIADVSEKSLALAAARGIDGVTCLPYDGTRIPLADASMDMALAACVFHHVPDTEHVPLLRDLRRVLRPGGHLVVFEHNPWNPLTVHAVNTCPFDANAVLITAPVLRARLLAAGFKTAKVRYRLFVPGPLRAIRGIERALTWLPIGAQYAVIGRAAPCC